MSDISASDAGVETAGAEVESADFDLDAAVEEFATSAPDEWKGKAGKIQSELKNLRGKYTPYRDTFDGLHESDRDAVFNLVTALKNGDAKGAAAWMRQAADGLDPAEKAAVEAAIEQVEATEEASEPELSVAEQIEKALAARDKAHREAVEATERQNNINAKFSELGLDVTRDDNGHLTDFRSQMVAQMAIKAGGDIDKGFEAFNKWLGDAAKDFVQAKGDPTLTAEGGAGAGSVAPGDADMTPAQRAQARLNSTYGGPQA